MKNCSAACPTFEQRVQWIDVTEEFQDANGHETRPSRLPDQTAPVGSYVVFDGKQATVLDVATYQAQYTPVPPPATRARNTGKRSAASNTER